MSSAVSEGGVGDVESNRYFHVNVSEVDDCQRSWSDMRKYGFVSVRNRDGHSKYLDILEIGNKIFVYQKTIGYVGYGIVTTQKTLADKYKLEDKRGLLGDQDSDQPNYSHHKNDKSLAEYLVGVSWIKSMPSEEGIDVNNIPILSKIVYEIRDRKAIKILKDKFIGESSDYDIPLETKNIKPATAPAVPPEIDDNKRDSLTKERRESRWSLVKEITIEKFKAVNRAIVPIGDSVTILVGPNASGKSSILQAIHWATRCASNIEGKDTVVLFDKIDYNPSSDPIGIFHNDRLKTNRNNPPIRVSFHHSSGKDQKSIATIDLRAARNQGGISVQIYGGSSVTPYKKGGALVSAYIPGLSGVLEKETIMAKVDVQRKSASGQASIVLRNILLNTRSEKHFSNRDDRYQIKLEYLNEFVQRIYPELEVDADFVDGRDIYIKATVGSKSEIQQPIESAATGVLQVIQIFSYLVSFEPKIALIEEPDSHLHPDKQRDLIETLEYASEELGTQIILTTHSPHIVREASPECKIVWMNKGEVKSDEAGSIRKLLGWGGLDKSVLFFIEDKKDNVVKQILRQWLPYYRQIWVCPCDGVENLPRNTMLNNLIGNDIIDVRVIVHRDRDFMTEEEVSVWKGKYSTPGVFTWVTRGSDVEAYYCSPEYIGSLFEISIESANLLIKEALENLDEEKVKHKFFRKRKRINFMRNYEDVLRRSCEIWNDHHVSKDITVVGRSLHNSLKSVAARKKFDSTKLDSFIIPKSCTIADDLEEIIRLAIDFQY